MKAQTTIIAVISFLAIFAGASDYPNAVSIGINEGFSAHACLESIQESLPEFTLLQSVKKNVETNKEARIIGFLPWAQMETLKQIECVATAYWRSYPNTHDRGLYIPLDYVKEQYWQACYQGPQAEIITRLKKGDHRNLRGIVSKVAASDKNILYDYQYVKDGPITQVQVIPCLFEPLDVYKTKHCEITFVDSNRISDDGDHSHISLEKYWKTLDPNVNIIDCENKTVTRITNTWHQSITVAQYKLMTAMNEQNIPMQTVGASSGGVMMGGSLDPLQAWSAALDLPFMAAMMQIELCDASILQFSFPGQVENQISGLGGSWCPWGVEAKTIKCEGEPTVESKTVEKMPMVMSERMTKYCAQKK